MNEEICPSSTVGAECNRVLVTCLFVYSYMTASPPHLDWVIGVTNSGALRETTTGPIRASAHIAFLM